MTQRLTIGIDPGLHGAIAALADGEPVGVWDMPTFRRISRSEVDGNRLTALIRSLRGGHPGAWVSACVELVTPMPVQGRKQGASSSFNFGEGSGKVKAVLESLAIPYCLATPGSWKARVGLIGQGKDGGRQLALVRFPSMAHELQRKKDDGRGDALLLALHGDFVCRSKPCAFLEYAA